MQGKLSMARKPVMLIVLDGWGIRETEHGNAIAQAETPNFDRWRSTCERAILHSSGQHVGLTPGQMGNSEVGHLNLGAGRIVYQDISRIANAIADGSLARHTVLQDAIRHVRESRKQLHLIGLLGSGGVHSHSDHLYALLDIARENAIDPVLHVITDGRDTPTQNGISFCRELTDKLAVDGNGRVATVSGRYYAMDRDRRWERTRLAYDAMAFRVAERRVPDAQSAIQMSYDAGLTDEFIKPTVIGDDDSLTIDPGDVLLCYNFRADRMRQLARAFVQRDFAGADQFPMHAAAFRKFGQVENFVFILDGDQRNGNVEQRTRQEAGQEISVLYLPGQDAPERWIWDRLQHGHEALESEVGVGAAELAEQMGRLNSVYDSASDRPSEIAKTKLRGLSEALNRTVPDLCRVVARLEAGRADSDLQPFVEHLESALLKWRAE